MVNSIENTKSEEGIIANSQRNKRVVSALYEEVLNVGKLELLPDFIAEEYEGIRGKKGAAGFEEAVGSLINAFPDIRWTIEDLIGEGNKVVVKWNWKGTHAEPFQHHPATGKLVSNDGIGIFEVKEGKITRSHILTDRLGFLQELDVLPSDLTALSAKKTHTDPIRFIDTFSVPAQAKPEFMERVAINRKFIKTLPGFIEDAAYERTDENGDTVFITIAVWENEAVLKNAKEAVQTEYKKQGFDPAELFKRLGISIDRGVYKESVRS